MSQKTSLASPAISDFETERLLIASLDAQIQQLTALRDQAMAGGEWREPAKPAQITGKRSSDLRNGAAMPGSSSSLAHFSPPSVLIENRGRTSTNQLRGRVAASNAYPIPVDLSLATNTVALDAVSEVNIRATTVAPCLPDSRHRTPVDSAITGSSNIVPVSESSPFDLTSPTCAQQTTVIKSVASTAHSNYLRHGAGKCALPTHPTVRPLSKQSNLTEKKPVMVLLSQNWQPRPVASCTPQAASPPSVPPVASRIYRPTLHNAQRQSSENASSIIAPCDILRLERIRAHSTGSRKFARPPSGAGVPIPGALRPQVKLLS